MYAVPKQAPQRGGGRVGGDSSPRRGGRGSSMDVSAASRQGDFTHGVQALAQQQLGAADLGGGGSRTCRPDVKRTTGSMAAAGCSLRNLGKCAAGRRGAGKRRQRQHRGERCKE